jgi:hypothetical protein
MAVDIEVFGQLHPGRPQRRTLEFPGPAAAREVAHAIGLDQSEIGLVTIDGVESKLDASVHPKSRLCFFPYLSGG